jgi:hypothetical protein
MAEADPTDAEVSAALEAIRRLFPVARVRRGRQRHAPSVSDATTAQRQSAPVQTLVAYAAHVP